MRRILTCMAMAYVVGVAGAAPNIEVTAEGASWVTRHGDGLDMRLTLGNESPEVARPLVRVDNQWLGGATHIFGAHDGSALTNTFGRGETVVTGIEQPPRQVAVLRCRARVTPALTQGDATATLTDTLARRTLKLDFGQTVPGDSVIEVRVPDGYDVEAVNAEGAKSPEPAKGGVLRVEVHGHGLTELEVILRSRRWLSTRDELRHHLGERAAMTDEELAAVLAAPPGTRITRDLDGDGDPDLADFVDLDPRHTVRPMVVRVLDDDDDMGADGLGDGDSDCYIADWRGDGSINRAVDYWDEDGDGDLDRQDLYYEPGAWHGGNHVEVVIIRDIGDDNRLWHTRNYEYQQRPCQWQSDFNGDEMFCMFYYDRAAEKFLAWLEAPFTHHDFDGDGAAEMTVQFLGSGETMDSIRFSFDADNDSRQPGNPRDYDFSFNCKGSVAVPEEWSRTETLRNGEVTGRYLDWPHARKLCETGAWDSCRLCWDEVDNNVNVSNRVERDHERWEGVGGYRMREGNKRWETDADFSGGMRLYYWPVDRRLHLFGAESGYIEVDYDFNMRTDAIIRYADRDGDGFFDEWSYDADADGTPERVIEQPGVCEIVPIDYDEFVGRYRSWVQAALDENASAIAELKAELGEDAHSRVEDWWLNVRPTGFYAADKLASSAECRRYYSDLIREELRLLADE